MATNQVRRRRAGRYEVYGRVIRTVLQMEPSLRDDFAPKQPTEALRSLLDEADRAELQGLLVEVLCRLASARPIGESAAEAAAR